VKWNEFLNILPITLPRLQRTYSPNSKFHNQHSL